MNTIYEAWIDPGNGDPCEDATYIEAESQETATAYANAQDHHWPIPALKQHPTVRVECADGRPAYRLLLFPPESNKDQAIIHLSDKANYHMKATEHAQRKMVDAQNTIASIPWGNIAAIVNAATDALDRRDPGHPDAKHIAAVNAWLSKRGEP